MTRRAPTTLLLVAVAAVAGGLAPASASSRNQHGAGGPRGGLWSSVLPSAAARLALAAQVDGGQRGHGRGHGNGGSAGGGQGSGGSAGDGQGNGGSAGDGQGNGRPTAAATQSAPPGVSEGHGHRGGGPDGNGPPGLVGHGNKQDSSSAATDSGRLQDTTATAASTVGHGPGTPPVPAVKGLPTTAASVVAAVTPGAQSTPATTPAPAASAPVTTAPAVSSATPTAPSAATPSAPARRPATRHAHRRGRHVRSRRAHLGGRTAATAATGASAGVARAAAPGVPAAARASRPSAAPPTSVEKRRAARPAGGFAAPLTRTVTRIIGVLPAPLRWVLAGLVAIGLALAAATLWMAVRARRLRRDRQRLASDLGLLEATLVPSVPERVGLASVSGAHRSADALAAGGDFYDAFELPGERTGLVMGDVEGHGRPAIPLTALVRYTLRAYLEAGLEPWAALRVGAGALKPQLGPHLVTAVVAIYDGRRGTLTYACAGHPPPMVVGANADSPAACSSPPIGAGLTTGRRQVTLPLAPGTAAVFYTDGAIDPRIDRASPVRRLADVLSAQGPEMTADDLLDRLFKSAALADDTSACVIRPLPEAAAGAVQHVEEIEFDRAGLARSGARFLEACQVAPENVAEAMRSARPIAQRAGAVVLTVRRSDGGASVEVAEPAPTSVTLSAAA